MRLRLATTAAVLVASASLALAGCGTKDAGSPVGAAASQTSGATGSASSSNSGSSSSGSSDAVQWADQFCGAMQSFVDVAKQPPKFDTSNPAAAKSGLSTYFGQLSDGFGKAGDQLKALPKAPTPSGDQVVSKMVDLFGQMKTAFADSKSKIDNADPNDPTAGMTAATESLSKLSDLTDPLKDVKADPELEKAASQAPKCQAMGASVSTPTS